MIQKNQKNITTLLCSWSDRLWSAQPRTHTAITTIRS